MQLDFFNEEVTITGSFKFSLWDSLFPIGPPLYRTLIFPHQNCIEKITLGLFLKFKWRMVGTINLTTEGVG